MSLSCELDTSGAVAILPILSRWLPLGWCIVDVTLFSRYLAWNRRLVMCSPVCRGKIRHDELFRPSERVWCSGNASKSLKVNNRTSPKASAMHVTSKHETATKSRAAGPSLAASYRRRPDHLSHHETCLSSTTSHHSVLEVLRRSLPTPCATVSGAARFLVENIPW